MDISADPDEASLEGTNVEFTPAEREVLAKICQKYRSTLPIYLRCVQPELELIEQILKKIA